MRLSYCIIEIYTSEEGRWQGKPLWEAVLNYVAKAEAAARCLVLKGVAGTYEDGELASGRIEVLSYNLPVKVEIVLPASECERVLGTIAPMVTDGVIAVREVAVTSHTVQQCLVPRRLRVRDVMATPATTVTRQTPVSDIIRLLVTAEFNAVPVLDDQGRPVGIVTQGDLIERAHMPIRLGLLAELDGPQLDEYLRSISGLTAAQVMTTPVVTIDADKRLEQLVQVMLKRGLKRLPVVDRQGKLVGMVARLDVFGPMVSGAMLSRSLAARDVQVGEVATVGDIMARDKDTVPPEATGAEILGLLRERKLQRVAVVDGEGRLLGLVTDLDLMTVLSSRRGGFWEYLSHQRDLAKAAGTKTAAQIMRTELVTVTEATTIDDAIRLMTEHGLKRLPVVDTEGLYLGMVSRQDVLGAGVSGDAPEVPRPS